MHYLRVQHKNKLLMGKVSARASSLQRANAHHMEKFAAWENLHRHSAELMDAKLVKGVSLLPLLYRARRQLVVRICARQFSTLRILNESKSDCCQGEEGRPV
jgi:hypothetical protein